MKYLFYPKVRLFFYPALMAMILFVISKLRQPQLSSGSNSLFSSTAGALFNSGSATLLATDSGAQWFQSSTLDPFELFGLALIAFLCSFLLELFLNKVRIPSSMTLILSTFFSYWILFVFIAGDFFFFRFKNSGTNYLLDNQREVYELLHISVFVVAPVFIFHLFSCIFFIFYQRMLKRTT